MPNATEEAIQGLAKLNFTTRQIAEQVGISQSTVVRKLRKIRETGPQPAFYARDNSLLPGDMPTSPQPAIKITDSAWYETTPQPVMRTMPFRAQRSPALIAMIICLLAAACSLLTAGILYKTVMKAPYAQVPASVPAPVIPPAFCIRYTGHHHYVSGMTITSNGACPAGWIKVTSESR